MSTDENFKLTHYRPFRGINVLTVATATQKRPLTCSTRVYVVHVADTVTNCAPPKSVFDVYDSQMQNPRLASRRLMPSAWYRRQPSAIRHRGTTRDRRMDCGGLYIQSLGCAETFSFLRTVFT
jgi:hypothetical protein